ncbi:copper resistance CopC family protein [Amycolatopsis marina]|nr:copper resistance CopC family protein [Amycolatopsis marina]
MFALLAGAGPASAHNVLISSDPEDGAQLDAGPDQVTLTFDQYVQDADVNQVAVTGPDGGQWTEGPVEVQENVVTAPLRPLGPAGEYTLGFRILSADGHSVQEKIRFTLTTAGTGTPAAGASASAAGADPGAENADPGSAEGDTDSGGVPIWVWIAAAVVLLGVGLTLALRMGRNAE